MGGGYKPTGKPRGRPRKDGLVSGSEAALQADKRARQGYPGRKAQRGAAERNGPNAAETSEPGHRGHTVHFSLPEKSGAEPADLAIAFLETLKIPEGKMAGQPLMGSAPGPATLPGCWSPLQPLEGMTWA